MAVVGKYATELAALTICAPVMPKKSNCAMFNHVHIGANGLNGALVPRIAVEVAKIEPENASTMTLFVLALMQQALLAFALVQVNKDLLLKSAIRFLVRLKENGQIGEHVQSLVVADLKLEPGLVKMIRHFVKVQTCNYPLAHVKEIRQKTTNAIQ